MNKNLFLPLFLSISYALAQDPPAENGSIYEVAPQKQHDECNIATQAAPYLAWYQEWLLLFKELADCLGKVSDEDSATTAAPKVDAIVEHLLDLLEREKHLGEPPLVVQQYFAAHRPSDDELKLLCETSYGKIFALMFDIEPPCYGSKALQHALQQFCHSITEYH